MTTAEIKMTPYAELFKKIQDAGSANYAWFMGGSIHTGGYRIMQSPYEYAHYILKLKEMFPNGMKNYMAIGLGTGGDPRFIYENVGFEKGYFIDNMSYTENSDIDVNIESFRDKVEFFKGDSTSLAAWDWVEKLPRMDYCFIDGDHCWPAVINDTLLCSTKAKIIGYHDRHFNPDKRRPAGLPVEVGHAFRKMIESNLVKVVWDVKDAKEPFGITMVEVNIKE